MTPTADWIAALDAFEACLDAQEALLSGGGDGTLITFVPPQLDQPLPRALAVRATSLLDRCHNLQTELRAGLDHVARQLQDLTAQQQPTPGDSQPLYFDSKI